MKILMILHSHICGGAEAHVSLLMNGLITRGHRVAFAGPLDSWLAEKAGAAGAELFHMPMHGMADLASAFLAVKAVCRYKPDFIHGHMVRGTHYATIAGRITGCPTVVTDHSTISYKRFNRAGHIIAVSEAVKDFLLTRGIRASKITRIYHGVPDRFNLRRRRRDVRERLGLREDEQALCMMARFIPDKGHDILLEALSLLSPDRHYKLFLAGDDTGPWATEIKRMTRDKGLQDRVVFLGFSDNVPLLLAGMDILVAPSRREALSLSILEAMSMGIPVIAARTGGIPELIQHEKNGLLVEREDPKDLLMAVSTLVSKPGSRRAYGQEGRRIFLLKFSEEIMLESHIGLYRSLIPQCSPSVPPAVTRKAASTIR